MARTIDSDHSLEALARARGEDADGIADALSSAHAARGLPERTPSQPDGAIGSGAPVRYVPSAFQFGEARARSRTFLIALALITLVPLIGFPLSLVAASELGTGPLPGMLALLAITGPMHVAATSFFFVDRDFRPVMGENPVRCQWSVVWLPLLILGVGVAGSALIGGWAFLLIFVFHNTWLFYHYQRQNFGLLSFISANFELGRLPPRVDTALNLGALGAIIGMLGTPGFISMLGATGVPGGDAMVGARVFLGLWRTGLALYVLSAAMIAWILFREPRLRANRWLLGGLILGTAFFLPAFLFRNPALAFLPYAVAHGAQYILMMSVLSGRSGRGWVAFLTMCALGAAIGLTIDSMRAWPAILAYMGIVEVHFLIDAKVWRLREPQQRAIMNRRFDFLLAR